MKKLISTVFILTVFFFPMFGASAEEAKIIREQRLKAHNERLVKKRQRTKEIAKARKSYKSFVRDLKASYKSKLKELDTEFNLKRVELHADAQEKIAELEEENRKAMIRYLMKSDKSRNMESIEKMKTENNGYMNKLFVLRKTSAKAIHEERIAKENRKNALLEQRDKLALNKAESLGLLKEYAPILAKPINQGLAKSEARWNEQEKKNAERINKSNQSILRKIESDKKIREWKIKNLKADFDLRWRENEERNKIDCEAARYNALILYSSGNTSDNAKRGYQSKLAELEKKKQMVKIKYKKINDQNMIGRREEEKRIKFR